MTELPAPSADPLHVLPTWGLFVLGVVLLATVMILAAWWWLRRRRTEGSNPAQRATLAAPRLATFVGMIGSLRRRILSTGAFREGCHQLAAATRAHLERVAGFDAEEMTSAEIAETAADGRIGRYMRELRGYQFSRKDPQQHDFLRACKRAESLFQ